VCVVVYPSFSLSSPRSVSLSLLSPLSDKCRSTRSSRAMKRFVLHAPHVSLPTLLAYAEDASKQNGRRCCAGRAAARRCCPFSRVPGARLAYCTFLVCPLRLPALPWTRVIAHVSRKRLKAYKTKYMYLEYLAMPTMHTRQCLPCTR
jgi:hypothetical protein